MSHPSSFTVPSLDSPSDCRSQWTRATDELFADGAEREDLPESIQPLQPFTHSADHLFPLHAILCKELKRFVPLADATKYRSASRGPP